MNVVFAGGGTGGHVYPAIAIADALRDRANVTFIGAADRLEATLVPKAGYALATVTSRPLTRRLSFDLLRMLWENARGTVQAMRILARVKPDIVIATGGYVCFPVVLAARILGKRPIALLEPNAAPGLTNRMLAPLVDEIWGAFADGDARFAGKYRHTGIPVRATLRALPPRDEAIVRLGLSAKRKTLLAMGGSQGARSINDALTALVKANRLPEGWQLIHVTGEKEYDRVRSALCPSTSLRYAQDDRNGVLRPYLHDLSDAYAAADLVLARSGASTLGELAATGRPAILVPYPYAADNHQRSNAERFAATGAAIVVEDRELVAGRLAAILSEATAPGRLEALRRAAERGQGDPVATILGRVEKLAYRKSTA